MNHSAEILNRAMDVLKLNRPVSSDVQDLIFKNKIKSVIKTLKRLNQYNAAYGIALRIYFFSARAGLGLSMPQIKIALAVISSIIIASAAAVIYLSLPIEKKEAYHTITKTETITLPVEEKKQEKQERKKITYSLGVSAFTGDGVSDKTLNRATDIIYDRLIQARGKDRIVRLKKSKNKYVINNLKGSIEKMGGTYVISIKIIYVASMKVVFAESEEVDSPDKIERACEVLAEKAAKAAP